MSKLLAGRYELVEKIGEGGMAVVYKAKDRLLNRYVAIKILRPEYCRDEQFVENFKRESQAAAGLQHQNIVAIYDVGKSGSINYIVMELVEGRPLSDIIEERGPLDYKVTIDISKQVAAALSLAHKHQIIHRDVKPHNIMITRDGIAKLTDFGIAKAVSSSTMVADTSKVIGSVHYFSPEQARGTYVDERSDIYSLGIVMYEMLTGRVPFDGDNPVEVALKHINQEIIPPSKLVNGIPPALEKCVLRATDKYQTNRYKTADEMLEDIKNIEFVTSAVGSAAFINEKGRSVALSDDSAQERRDYTAAIVENTTEKKPTRNGSKEFEDDRRTDDDKRKTRRLIILIAVLSVVAMAALLGILYASGIIGTREEQIEVPDLKGYTYEQAEEMLKAKGLEIKKADGTVASEEIPEGSVVSQQPVKGTMVKKGRTVTVTLSEGNTDLVAPDLTNKTYEEAKNLLSDMGLQIAKGDDVESDSIEKGRIAQQYPVYNTQVAKGDIITVKISVGKGSASIPRLIGKEFTSDADIDAYLNQFGYSLGEVSYEESSTADPGYIINQDPVDGTAADKGTKVNIVVSKAPSSALMVDLTGKTQVEAEQLLKEKGFVLGAINYEKTNDKPAGTVVRQDPALGIDTKLGSSVNIWIAVPETNNNPNPPENSENQGTGNNTGTGNNG